MAKTTRPNKQLELPIMVDLRSRSDQQTAHLAGVIKEAPTPSSTLLRHTSEATAGDLSIYDAILSSYLRGPK
jgi:hypothetical protein